MPATRNGSSKFKVEHPDLRGGGPFTAQELEGTDWHGGDWKFRFSPDDVLLGKWPHQGQVKIENNRVVIDVVGSHFELDIVGKHLVSHGGYEIERIKE